MTPIKYKVSNDTLDNYPLAELWRETSKKLDLDYKLILDILFYSISTCGYNETEKVGFHLYIQMSLTLKNKIKYIQNLKNLNLMDLQENF